jgi:hypothetical protein
MLWKSNNNLFAHLIVIDEPIKKEVDQVSPPDNFADARCALAR